MAEVDVRILSASIVVCAMLNTTNAYSAEVRIKDIARIGGVRENSLSGYGLVFGLAGTGDTARSRATVQSIANMLKKFGVNVGDSEIAGRNVAAVIVTGRLPSFAEPGQQIDVQVASSGDARSLNGGTLLLTPLVGPDGSLYAMAQGAISVSGYIFEGAAASAQKNHPTVGRIPSGATVEQASPLRVSGNGLTLNVLLNEADFTNASRVAEAIRRSIPGSSVSAEHAGKVQVKFAAAPDNMVEAVAKLENLIVDQQRRARVVVNERSGTVVAGGDVRLGGVSISHGNLSVDIQTEYLVSQPSGVLVRPGSAISSVVVPQTRIGVEESEAPLVQLREGATVGDLVMAMRGLKRSTRDVIAVLQAIKAAGALDGELLIQ